MPIILGYMFQDPQWVPGTAAAAAKSLQLCPTL